MTINQLLDSIYLIPALLDHLDNPTDNTHQILQNNGINNDLVIQAGDIRHLLEYHKWIVQNNFRPNYTLLREGLAEYFEHYQSNLFKDFDIVGKAWMFLDYGCGEGRKTKQFLIDNPESSAVMVDKVNDHNQKNMLEVDFEKNPYWFQGYIDMFDLILLSEVLHCKKPIIQEYLLISSLKMLKTGGKLLIVENVDHCMEYRISKIKGQAMPLVTVQAVFSLMKPLGVTLSDIKYNQNHISYLYEKI